jgi:hypothetical protein
MAGNWLGAVTAWEGEQILCMLSRWGCRGVGGRGVKDDDVDEGGPGSDSFTLYAQRFGQGCVCVCVCVCCSQSICICESTWEVNLCPVEHETIIQTWFPIYSQGEIISCFYHCLLGWSVCLVDWHALVPFEMMGTQQKCPREQADTAEKVKWTSAFLSWCGGGDWLVYPTAGSVLTTSRLWSTRKEGSVW